MLLSFSLYPFIATIASPTTTPTPPTTTTTVTITYYYYFKMGYVLMEQEGAVGRFNRGQRQFLNYLEQAPFLIMDLLLAGFVFPFPAFCCASAFAVCKLISAIGYVGSADGRTPGKI